eukprot:5783969-Alexandrium_andersonii.AAC.1
MRNIPLMRANPPTVPPPGERSEARVESEDVLAAATEQCRQGGVGPEQTVAAAAHFRERDDLERRAVRDAVVRLPDERSRQVVLERGHDPAV